MRIIFSILALSVCIYAGHVKSKTLSLRTVILEGLLEDIRTFKDVMELSPLPFSKIVEDLSRKGNSKIWEAFGGKISPEKLISEAWCECVQESRMNIISQLDENDIKALLDLGSVLSLGDRQGQCESCGIILRRLEKNLESAKKERDKKGRMYSSMGVLCGLAFALLII